MSKKAKIAIIAGVTAGVIIISTIVGVLIWAFTGGGPSGAVDLSNLSVYTDNKLKLGTEGMLGKKQIVLDSAFPGGSEFVIEGDIAEIKDAEVGYGEDIKTIKVAELKNGINDGKFVIKYKDANGKKAECEVEVIKDAYNIYDEIDLDELRDNGTGNTFIFQDNVVVTEEVGFTLNDTTIWGNGFELDANSIACEGNGTFEVAAGKTGNIYELHIYGKKLTEEEKQADGGVSLDMFEGYGTILGAYGNSKDDSNRPKLNVKGCIIENAHKIAYLRGCDAYFEGNIFRNASDAIIAVETNTCKGAVVNMKNNVLANSVVAGVLFCGWTDVQ